MRRFAAVVGAAALSAGAAGAAPVPVQTRAEAIENLKAAIEDEKRAIELLKKDPPHLRAARDRIYRSADLVNGVYDFLSGVPNAAAGQDALGGARADDYASAHLLPTHYGPRPKGVPRAIEFLERALLRKRAALPFVQDAQPPPAVPSARMGRTTMVTESPTGHSSQAARRPGTCARAHGSAAASSRRSRADGSRSRDRARARSPRSSTHSSTECS